MGTWPATLACLPATISAGKEQLHPIAARPEELFAKGTTIAHHNPTHPRGSALRHEGNRS